MDENRILDVHAMMADDDARTEQRAAKRSRRAELNWSRREAMSVTRIEDPATRAGMSDDLTLFSIEAANVEQAIVHKVFGGEYDDSPQRHVRDAIIGLKAMAHAIKKVGGIDPVYIAHLGAEIARLEYALSEWATSPGDTRA